MLQIKEISFDYPDKPLLNKISFSLSSGQLLHLRGKNGAGKTTLLRLIAGLLITQSGEICYQGQPIQENFAAYYRQLCYLGHKTAINPLLTVRENCFFDIHYHRKGSNFESLLNQFGLDAVSDEYCYHISSGQKRRVGLIRLAMTDAKLFLLDEPLVALDQEAVGVLIKLLEHQLNLGSMIILTSHQPLPLNQAYQELFI